MAKPLYGDLKFLTVEQFGCLHQWFDFPKIEKYFEREPSASDKRAKKIPVVVPPGLIIKLLNLFSPFFR
jgi:hypothetical protein